MRSTRLRTTNYLAMLLALCLPACVQAATEAELCARDLEDIAQFMPANDAGASDALARRGAAINDALLKARGEMPQVSDRAGCDASIYHYLQAWRRGHLWSQPRDNSTAPSRPAGQPGYVRDPTLRVLSKQTIVLTLPSFRSEIQAELKALLTKERAVLAGHPKTRQRQHNGLLAQHPQRRIAHIAQLARRPRWRGGIVARLRPKMSASPRLQIMVDRRIAAGAVAHLRHLATRLKQSIVDRRAAPRQSIAGAGVVGRHELGDIFQIARAQFCLCRSLDAGWQAKRQQHGQIIRGSQSRAPHR